MSRSRTENRRAHTLGIHDLKITGREKLLISWLVGDIQGLDKQDSRVVARLIEEFDLENLTSIPPEDVNKSEDHVLSGYEVKFLYDQLNEAFRSRKVKPMYAIAATRLEDRLRDALDGAGNEEQEEPPKEEVDLALQDLQN